ncbi:hypothetical protein MRX96_016910 [Rhipicephalus microplus]
MSESTTTEDLWIKASKFPERELSKAYKNAQEVAFLSWLAGYFGDKEQGLFKVFEHGTSITEVLSELPPTPIIAALGSCFISIPQRLPSVKEDSGRGHLLLQK